MSITITGADMSYITIDPPEWGYTVDINMAIRIVKTTAGYKMFDCGASYDYRICNIPMHTLSKTQSENLINFINDSTKGRNAELSVNLGTDSGFYMFGPDKGDTGIFNCRILERKHSTLLYDPWQYASSSFQLHMITEPVSPYTLPEAVSEGDFTIGNVSGLKWPQAGFDASTEYGLNAISGYANVVKNVDINRNIYESDFTIDCNNSNAGALIDFLAGANGRAYDISLIAPANMYPFGIENGHSKTFTTKLLLNKISVTHNNNEQFSIPLKFWMVP